MSVWELSHNFVCQLGVLCLTVGVVICVAARARTW